MSSVTAICGHTGEDGEPARECEPPWRACISIWPGGLRDLALSTPGRAGAIVSPRPGVYAQVPGPQFETPAEIRMLRTAGADVVGMSMALETIAARQSGAEVTGLALVTNPAATTAATPDIVRHVVGSLP